MKKLLSASLFIAALIVFTFSAQNVKAANSCESLGYSTTAAVNGKVSLTLNSGGLITLTKSNSSDDYIGNDGNGTSYKLNNTELSKQGGATGSVRSHTYLAICSFTTINTAMPTGKSAASAAAKTDPDAFTFKASGLDSIFCEVKSNGKRQCDSYEEWVTALWNFAAVVAIPIASVVFMIAGIMYAYSGGDPKKHELAKKLIYGALSGIAILVLSKMIIITFLELDGAWNLSMTALRRLI